ncbi:MAG TPA: hypothetical protein VF589_12570 [Allosphingosinicella sp.]|jgi:hypothetical protein
MMGLAAVLLIVGQGPAFKVVETPPPPDGQTPPPIVKGSPDGAIMRVPRLDPAVALRSRGFSEGAIRTIMAAARTRMAARPAQMHMIERLKQELAVERSSDSPSADRIEALLRRAAAASSADLSERVGRTLRLLRALPPADLKLYLRAFGPDEPEFLALSVIPTVR